MRILILSIPFYLFYLTGNAQNKLYQRAFFNLAFESTPQDLKGSLELDLTISYGLKYYKYKSKDLKEVYGRKVSEINLGFRDDKLEYIDLYFNRLNHEDFEVLRSDLEQDFGSSAAFDAVEKGVLEAFRWQGTNTTIDLYRYGSEVVDSDDRNKTVLAISRPLK